MTEENQKYIAAASKVVKESYCGESLALDCMKPLKKYAKQYENQIKLKKDRFWIRFT